MFRSKAQYFEKWENLFNLFLTNPFVVPWTTAKVTLPKGIPQYHGDWKSRSLYPYTNNRQAESPGIGTN